ncbi:hypothetical protein J4D99_13615 [Siccationidurans ginsengisoli]|uniref:hypothetical protein n=1 Tax=Hymenobacter TaxID=89966 RepID=UPI001AAC9082|nr:MULTISPECIES: hypothetical protein [unclassified Hymenobacter]MBO2032428.1 hypothetical protein [Hymenobacter sp. BT559]
MPAWKPVAESSHFRYSQNLSSMPQAELDKIRRWQTVDFTGNGITDFIGLDNTQQYLCALGNDSCREAGIRLRFHHQARYACFMEVLYNVWAKNVWYWLDVHREPMVLYIVTPPFQSLPYY